MTTQPHDFTLPPRLPPELRSQVAPWLNRTASILTENVLANGAKVDVKRLDCQSGRPLETLETWVGKPLAFRMQLAGSVAFLALPNRLAQSVVAAWLGTVAPTDHVERPLTPVETALCQMTAEMFVASLCEAWLGESPVAVELGEPELNLRRSKAFRPDDPLVLCRFTVAAGGAENLMTWIVRWDSLASLWNLNESEQTTASPPVVRRQLESLVRDMKTPVEVRLGSAQLTAPQLAELRVGDLVVLNQRTSEPLKAYLAGEPKFIGWPGQIGQQQAFQITAEVSRRRTVSATEQSAAAG